ncbi:endonuclease Q family protein [Patescibacteria group bacterium]|nr:endonuclease Q family protein [Patescibacteria group bacterium]MBU1931375.1 endonuclease Q family protein [Patescibacteria group bacterium]
MKITADLHLHSKYSRAVSPRMSVFEMARWGSKKGIDLLGTADITHPLWLKELEANLEEADEGTYQLKAGAQNSAPGVKFVLAGEISSIYSQGGKGRRIHNLIIVPSFSVVKKINSQLLARGCNLMSDGRPIIGLSSMDLAELVFGVSDDCLIVPCHVWTPWFSLYGSKSGFDSIEECFGPWADKIYAIETGLSSDPAMNWRIKDLENRSIISCSDAHSPEKLGREATIFKFRNKESESGGQKFSYQDLAGAIKQDPKSNWQIAYTIEFYPEEGKYHYSGHRKCGIRHSPDETEQKGALCPTCGKELTLGVMHRVQELADRKVKIKKQANKENLVGYFDVSNPKRPPYVMLVPLIEIIAEAIDAGTQTQKAQSLYHQLVDRFKSEFSILMEIDLKAIKNLVGERVAEGVAKVRQGDIVVDPGYDGVFGVVSIWPKEGKVLVNSNEQMGLF